MRDAVKLISDDRRDGFANYFNHIKVLQTNFKTELDGTGRVSGNIATVQ